MPHQSEVIAFVWDNFGPPHVDRCEATARHLQDKFRVVGLELFSRSETYSWTASTGVSFEKHTLFHLKQPSSIRIFIRLLGRLKSLKARHIFLCHYQEWYILCAATLLRVMGKRVYFMGDSKFDDYCRWVGREWLKSFYLAPYVGALTASIRSKEYLEFLGWGVRPIELGYDTISVDRIRRLACSPPAPNGVDHSERHFTIVARYVPKKNIALALQAFADQTMRDDDSNARKLVLCGSGPLESELREQARRLSIDDLVEFRGFVQTDEVCRVLSKTLCLILPSIEEQFGQVVPEALAMGVPIVLSTNCGARDELVRSGVNGFVIEPDNVTGLRNFLSLIARDAELWARMSRATQLFVSLGDVERFARAVGKLIAGNVELEARSLQSDRP